MKIINTILLITFICLIGCNGQNQHNSKANQLEVDTLKTSKDSLQDSFLRLKQEIDSIDLPQSIIGSPVLFPISVAGSFGEMRGNHFHAGLDIRTMGSEGHYIIAVEDGYVSRINVSTYGYGKALYINHPKLGIVSVYGHLQQFYGKINQFVYKEQYRKQKYTLELYPSSNTLKVKKGDTIALSGNTGGSAGPHLHFEIRNIRNSKPQNPLKYLSVYDKMNPIIGGIVVWEKNESVRDSFGYYPFYQLKVDSEKSKTIKVKPGKYLLGASMRDYFTDKLNVMGVNKIQLYQDGKIVFQSKIDELSFDMGRKIKAHFDYPTYALKGVRYVKLYKDKYNPLPFYDYSSSAGLISVNTGDTLRFVLKIEDDFKHKDSLSIIFIGEENSDLTFLRPIKCNNKKLIKAYSGGVLENEVGKVIIPKNALLQDEYISVSRRQGNANCISSKFKICTSHLPIIKSATIQLDIPNHWKEKDKLVVLNEYGKSEGGKKVGNTISTTVKYLGAYCLAADLIKPNLELISANQKVIKMRMSDNLSGIKYYRAEIDKKWVLIDYEPKRNLAIINLGHLNLKGEHLLEVVVKDLVGNSSYINQKIKF